MHELDPFSVFLASVTNVVVIFIVILYIPLYFTHYIPYVNYMYINKIHAPHLFVFPWGGGAGLLKIVVKAMWISLSMLIYKRTMTLCSCENTVDSHSMFL